MVKINKDKVYMKFLLCPKETYILIDSVKMFIDRIEDLTIPDEFVERSKISGLLEDGKEQHRIFLSLLKKLQLIIQHND